MLLLHKALLAWLIQGTPPNLWEIECLNKDIVPPLPPQHTTAPTHYRVLLRPSTNLMAYIGDLHTRILPG